MPEKIKRINLDYIYDSKAIKKRCKFIIFNIDTIIKYDVKDKEKYGQHTFRYKHNNISVNFYGKRANDIYDRAVASIIKIIEA